jgi:hypothetical protein
MKRPSHGHPVEARRFAAVSRHSQRRDRQHPLSNDFMSADAVAQAEERTVVVEEAAE